MKRNIVGLAGALLLVAMAGAASAAPYDGPRDRPNNDGADGAGLPGLPGGRGGRGGQPERELASRASPQNEARLKRYCGDLLRRRPGRLDPNFRPRDCEDWFAQLDRSYASQAPRDAGGHGAREGADGPSVAGGQGGPGGAPGRGPGGADGGNGGAGVAGGTGGAGGKGGDGY